MIALICQMVGLSQSMADLVMLGLGLLFLIGLVALAPLLVKESDNG